MSGVISDDYPEHLNPFDEKYDPLASVPVAPPRSGGSRQKYNTWTSNRHQVQVKQKPTLLEKPWVALNISPKGKLVRRLSILKTAVERFATKKKKRLDHSPSLKESKLLPRSNSLHEDFNYRIISPKLKEKIRQQVFSRSISTQEQDKTETTETSSQSPQLNGRLELTLKLDSEEVNVSTESESNVSALGARPKTRKKRPPPPPPVDTPKPPTLEVTNGQEKSDDSFSANSSITQDLEKDASTDDEHSLTELDQKVSKQREKNC